MRSLLQYLLFFEPELLHSDLIEKPPINDKSADRELKDCAYSQCNNQHDHNNSCCSPECYKLYRKEKSLTLNSKP